MYYVIASLVLVAIVVICMSACSLGVRIIIARIKGDEFEYHRLKTTYEMAEIDSLINWGKTHGMTSEIFAKYWEREKKRDPKVLPYDVYVIIMEELDILHEPDPEIWS